MLFGIIGNYQDILREILSYLHILREDELENYNLFSFSPLIGWRWYLPGYPQGISSLHILRDNELVKIYQFSLYIGIHHITHKGGKVSLHVPRDVS